MTFLPHSLSGSALAAPPKSQKKKAFCENEEPLIVDQVQDHLSKMNAHKPTGLYVMHPWILSELADKTAKILSIIVEKLWQLTEIPTNWKRET